MCKKYIIFTIFSLLALACHSDAEHKPVLQTENLQKTFQSVAEQENRDFYKKDLAAWSNHFVHSDAVYWICVEEDVTLRATGWNDLYQFVGQWMKENPAPESDALLKQDQIEDFHVEISNDLAFVRYKKKRVMPDGQTKILLENRVFKYSDKSWKILGMVSAPGYTNLKSTPNVFVHNAAASTTQ